MNTLQLIEIFKANDLIELNHNRERWVWTEKAQTIAVNAGYRIQTNFALNSEKASMAWLLEDADEEFGFNWIYDTDEEFNKYSEATLNLFGVNNNVDLPIDVEDIVL